MEIRQTVGVQKKLNVCSVIIDCNCKELRVNPIIKSRTRYYSSCKSRMRANVIGKGKNGKVVPVLK
jgi:hypothetical protein